MMVLHLISILTQLLFVFSNRVVVCKSHRASSDKNATTFHYGWKMQEINASISQTNASHERAVQSKRMSECFEQMPQGRKRRFHKISTHSAILANYGNLTTSSTFSSYDGFFDASNERTLNAFGDIAEGGSTEHLFGRLSPDIASGVISLTLSHSKLVHCTIYNYTRKL